ncbi:uncharacterized protein EDB91DRAFT_1083699 [Suillus paluster]|uniref:uncharacterized protein n=1 Tax=Suillus paluster TaxID=48578 RepID=UPI001B85B718|nr:uncharacterized protein EDB91DRAFT_1083699 [Suillus paluster]KAG1735614.1 hypothetical protein EDB91DRAFT_1083699 [Suillus paluster]
MASWQLRTALANFAVSEFTPSPGELQSELALGASSSPAGTPLLQVVIVTGLFSPVTASSNSSSSFVSATLGASATTASVITVPISSYSFIPYPAPTLKPYPPVFLATDPLTPPDVSSDPQIVPDFTHAWAIAYKKAKKLISDYTIEEKVNITTGAVVNQLCVGNIPPNKNFPGLCSNNGPLAVSVTDFTTLFPAGIHVASTWNRALMRARGLALGQEFKGKGINIALGPMMNVGRIPQGGRNWEGFGADPFLTGESAYETILGMQQGGVQATAKHFINNEQEHFRNQASSNVDDRTQHEIYAHPFLRSVMAGVSSIMCSYSTPPSRCFNDILKREYGFRGFVQSDWSATMSTLSAVAGLDMTMPGDITFYSNDSYFGGNLTKYVNDGYISMARLDDMATRIIAGWYFLHQDEDYPATNFNTFNPTDEATNKHVNVQADHYKLVREIGAAGTVLLKNTNGTLPLNKPRNMLLVGSDAGPGNYIPGELSPASTSGILAMGWGSGAGNFPYLISPLEGIQHRARQDGSSVFWAFDDWNTPLVSIMAFGQAVALVFINSDSGEGYITVDGNEGDRKNLTAWNNGDHLILAVAAQNNNTIVVVNSVGPLIVEPWIEHPNVTAVVWAGIQGQEAGNAIADVLYGAYNPSGKLPYTIAKDPADYPAQLVTGGSRSEILTINYTEGLFVDYRHFDQENEANITPRFEFGFGLSYTTFSYSDLCVDAIQSLDVGQAGLIAAWEDGGASPIAEGSSAALWLHEPAFRVTFKVTNTGFVSGTEPLEQIPQLYIHYPSSASEPPSVLKGFTNVEIDPYETELASITLSRYDLSIWDVVAQGWRKPDGQITTYSHILGVISVALVMKHWSMMLQHALELKVRETTVEYWLWLYRGATRAGASGGIGLETVKLFCALGANVTAHYNSQFGPIQELLASNANLQHVQANLSQEEAVVAMFESLSTMPHGPVQVAVVNHAIYLTLDVPIARMTLDQWNTTITTNLTSSFLDKAAIVLIGSISGKYGEANHADYAATKSAMMYGLNLTLKNEIVKIAPKGRVNCIAPGWVKTPMAEEALKDPHIVYCALATTPLKRVAMPMDVATQIAVLASSTLSGHVSGQVVMVDGGMEGCLLNTPEDLQGC